MIMLRVEHTALNYDEWKRAFDSDPVGRQQMGVRRYRILRAVDDPNYVLIDLEFDTAGQATALLESLHVLWGRIEGTVITGPQARIVEVVEARRLS